MELEGRVALVTGGGRGIGRGIVDRFLAEGARVAVAQRRELEPELADHEAVLGISADLVATDGLRDVVSQVTERFGGLDILVNNAGAMFERSVAEITVDEWDRMLALNLRTPLFLTQAAAPALRERGGGSIISIGSVEGIGTNPRHAAYSASKAGVHGLTRALAVDLGPDGIRCNAIAPGWISSDLSEDYLDSAADPVAARAALDALHPVRRTGRARDVGDLAVFLASDRSAFITGETIVVDGGRTVQLPLPPGM